MVTEDEDVLLYSDSSTLIVSVAQVCIGVPIDCDGPVGGTTEAVFRRLHGSRKD